MNPDLSIIVAAVLLLRIKIWSKQNMCETWCEELPEYEETNRECRYVAVLLFFAHSHKKPFESIGTDAASVFGDCWSQVIKSAIAEEEKRLKAEAILVSHQGIRRFSPVVGFGWMISLVSTPRSPSVRVNSIEINWSL